MKRIFNWTFGSIFRTFGRIIAYLLVGLILSFILSKTGFKLPDLLPIMRVNAATINYTEGKYRVRRCSSHTASDCEWISGTTNFGTNTTLNSNNYVLGALIARFTTTLNRGVTYRIVVNVNSSPQIPSTEQSIDSYLCGGIANKNNWNSDTSLIESCNLVQSASLSNSNNSRYIFDVKPFQDIQGLQLQWYYTRVIAVDSIRVLTSSYISTDTSQQDSINNQTNELIQNENNNTQNIINNQNELLGSKCGNLFDYNLSPSVNALGNFTYTNNNGIFTINGSDSNYKYIGYSIQLEKGTYYYGGYNGSGNAWDVGTLIETNSQAYACNSNYCTFTIDSNQTITFYPFRVGGTIYTANNLIIKPFISKEIKSYCEYGTYSSKLDDTNNSINNVNDTLNDDDTTGATSEAGDFFSSFTTNTHGLTGIITAPLNAIQSLTSKSCSPLVLPLPFVNQNLTLPCMRDIYVQNFGAFMNIYDVITLGIISYWVMVRIFALVKDFKNPDHDEIEVIDL